MTQAVARAYAPLSAPRTQPAADVDPVVESESSRIGRGLAQGVTMLPAGIMAGSILGSIPPAIALAVFKKDPTKWMMKSAAIGSVAGALGIAAWGFSLGANQHPSPSLVPKDDHGPLVNGLQGAGVGVLVGGGVLGAANGMRTGLGELAMGRGLGTAARGFADMGRRWGVVGAVAGAAVGGTLGALMIDSSGVGRSVKESIVAGTGLEIAGVVGGGVLGAGGAVALAVVQRKVGKLPVSTGTIVARGAHNLIGGAVVGGAAATGLMATTGMIRGVGGSHFVWNRTEHK